jgi:hypothetical protein
MGLSYRTSILSLSLPLCILAACASDDDPSNADVVDELDASGSDVSADSTSDAAPDAETEADALDESDVAEPLVCPEGVAVAVVTGTTVDSTGAPVTDGRGQVCLRSAPEGRLTCLRPEATDDSGRFVVEVPREVGCFESAVMRAFSVGGTLGSIYCPVDLGLVDTDTQTLPLGNAITLWSTLEPVAREEVTSPDDYGVITFDGDLRVRVKPSALLDGDDVYEELRAQRYSPEDVSACFIEEGVELYDLWAFGPETDVTGEIFRLEVPNNYELEPGDTVAIWLLGGIGTTLGRAGFVDEGEFRRVSRGQVSEDGTTIVSEGGVAAFTWLGIGPDVE